MYKTLNAGAIGIRDYTLARTIALADTVGFEGIDFDIREASALAKADGIETVKKLFVHSDIQPGVWSPPVDWRGDNWEEDLKALPEYAEVAQELGALRTATWCPPSSPDLTYEENFKFHVERYGGIAETLKPYGIRFGIEFIGPEHMRPDDQHDFIYTMEGMLELCEAIGTGNVGLLLDAYHLFTSGGKIDDMDKLTNDDIVNVHVNDAPEGLSLPEYQDLDRRLPLETGVIPLERFMKKLIKIGYDGPVTVEPFSKRVNDLDDPNQAAELTMEYLDKLWDVAGLQ